MPVTELELLAQRASLAMQGANSAPGANSIWATTELGQVAQRLRAQQALDAYFAAIEREARK